MLLHEVLGPCSFADLRRFENQLLPTYREAAAKTGLLENDQRWDDTLEEAAVVRAPKQLRQLFAIMLLTCGISNPKDLCDKHKESLAEDFHHRCRQEGMDVQVELSELTFNEWWQPPHLWSPSIKQRASSQSFAQVPKGN